jgi:diguanylate cyclase (GGDEF)-like protein
LRVPIPGTAVESIVPLGNGTHSWDDMQLAFPTPRVRGNGWRSAIVTMFESGGSTYLLWFVSRLQTGPWEAQDHAYVEVIGSYFASQAQLRWQFDQIQYHQTHDVLTGLLNRSQFRSQSRLASIKSDGYAVIAVNMDGFAEVNETYGNMIGDALLVEVAAGISERTVSGEIVGRLGGDVFAVFIPSPGSPAAVRERAAHLAERFRQPFSTGDRDGKEFVTLSARFGMAVAPQHGDSIDTIISHAGVAASAAKAQGPDAFAFYDATMEVEA